MLEVKRRSVQDFVATIGKFDGVHSAHQTLINLAVSEARHRNISSLVFSLTPNPAYILGYTKDRTEITEFRNKYKLLSDLGVDCFCPVRFNLELSQKSARDFISSWFVERFNVKKLIFGSDFKMGKQKEVGGESLIRLLAEFQIDAKEIDLIREDQHKISSSRIKELIVQGEFAELEKLLNRKFSLVEKVIHGNRLGRTIGFPTANLRFKNQLLPPLGVYATKIILDGKTFQAVTNVGRRPTVSGKDIFVESYLLDYNGSEFYNEEIEVIFIKKIREEIKFLNLDLLKKQINDDLESARELFLNEA